MQPVADTFHPSFYERAIQTKTRQALREQYDLSKPLPHGFLTLLTQLNDLPEPEETHSSNVVYAATPAQ
jgi:hypothetical protein